MSRRHLLLLLAIPAISVAQAPGTFRVEAQPGWTVLFGHEQFREAERIAVANLENAQSAFTRQRESVIAGLKTRAGWQDYRAATLAKLREALGPFPARTPLNAKLAGTLRREGYTVEKLIFESRPRYYVTANAYVPANAKPPFPAVLCPVGHWGTGKAYEDYQRLAIYLARRGFLVLVYDLPGQGERLLYYDSVLGRSLVDPATSEYYVTIEHGVAIGPTILATGNNLAPYEVWDGIRAIDYLCERKDVDRKRIACTGTSGGGLQTEMLAALDERIKVAIPVSYGGCAADHPDRPGLAMADVDALIAPRPLLMMNATGDSRGGVLGKQKRHALTAGLYRALDAGDRIAFLIGDGRHGYLHDLRAAAYQWLSRWLLSREAADLAEPATAIESDEDLACTATGQVKSALGGDSMLTLNRAAAGSGGPRAPTRQAIADKLKFAGETAPLDARVLGRIPKDGYTVEKLVYYSEPGVYIPSLLYLPKAGGPRPAVVLVNEGGKSAGSVPQDVLEPLARAGYAVLAIDPRGTGETTPPTSPPYNQRNYRGFTEDSEADLFYDALRAGKTMLGLRVLDVLRGVDYLASRAEVDRARISAIGQGSGALLALYAAALDERIRAAACTRMLVSYRSILASELYAHRPSYFVPGALGLFDLPDVARLVAPRPLLLVNVADQKAQRMPLDEATREYQQADRQTRVTLADTPAELLREYLRQLAGI